MNTVLYVDTVAVETAVKREQKLKSVGAFDTRVVKQRQQQLDHIQLSAHLSTRCI